MFRRGLWVLLLAAAPPAGDDRAARDLLQAVRTRVDQARSLRIEGKVATQGDDGPADASFTLRIRGTDRWAIEVRQPRARDSVTGFNIAATCDGKKIVLVGAPTGAGLTGLKPDDGGRILRSALTTTGIAGLEAQLYSERDAPLPEPVLEDVKDGGKERVGETDARVIDFTLREGAETAKVRLLVDPDGRRILRKEQVLFGVKTVETYTAFAFDEVLPDSDFSYLSPRRLARVRAAELARSVALYGTYTGRSPRSLDDLARRPDSLEPEVFWPEGGFVLGGAVPKDPWGRPFELRLDRGRATVVGLGSDGRPGGAGDAEDTEVPVPAVTRRPVGAPTDRLLKHYTARVQLQLLAGAVRLYREATGGLPRKKADLWDRPADALAWPDGGYLPGGRLPLDPWGQPYRIISDADRVRVQVRDPDEHALAAKSLGADETRRLEEIARPRVTDEERRAVGTLLDRLSEDDFDAREKAEQELKAWGPAVHGLLEERLKSEKDGETRLRIEGIRKANPARRPAWTKELAPLLVTVGLAEESGSDPALVSACSNHLTQLWQLQQVYATQFGGRQKKMPDATGRDFWRALTKTQPPLVDDGNEVFMCPASGDKPGSGQCAYRGPAKSVSQLENGDIVGMCDDEGHGDVVIVLRKSGDVTVISRGDAAYEEALEKTRP